MLIMKKAVPTEDRISAYQSFVGGAVLLISYARFSVAAVTVIHHISFAYKER